MIKLLNKLISLFNNTYNEKAYPNIPKYVQVEADYKSEEYRNKIMEFGFSKHEANLIVKGVRKIFNNNKSAEVEGFYAVDLKSKKTFYNGNGSPKSVLRPKDLNEFLKNNPNSEDADVIIIHNHRGNTMPSPSDLFMVSQFDNSNKGIVIGNGGNIYYYEIKRKIAADDFIKFKIKDDQCDTMEKRKEELLKFCKNNGIIFIEKEKEAL